MALEPSFRNALHFAQELIRIPSPPGGEGAVARRVQSEMEALAYDDVRIDDVGNVIGRIRGTSGAPPLMLNCHMDVVEVGRAEEWEYPPFGGVVEDGFLHGRGAMDIKGPLALQTHAAAALRGTAPGDILVAHTVFEERGGWGMEYLLRSGEVEPRVVILGEATHGDIAIGHRGRAEVEVVLRGVAGHASAPDRARNPLEILGPVLEAVADLAAAQDQDPVLGPASIAPTTVEVSPSSRNVIPDRAVLVLDWRVLPGWDHEGLLHEVREALRRRLPSPPAGLGVEVRMAEERQTTYTGRSEVRGLFTPGFLMEREDPLVRRAAKVVGRKDAGGKAVIRPWTFATDGGWSQGVFGIPTLGFAPGEERFAHTNRERLDLEEAEWSFSRLSELIPALQSFLC